MAQSGSPMVISCCDTAGKAPNGLKNNHAYTLLDVVVLKGVHLAKIRNPWGGEGYNGPWSDKDPIWTPALLKEAGHTLGNDGIFYMPFLTMISKPYFRSTIAAIYKDFTKFVSYGVTQKTEFKTLTFNVPSDQVVYFTFEVDNPRFWQFCDNKPFYHINTLLFKGKVFQGRDQIIGERGWIYNTVFHNTLNEPGLKLTAGTYSILVHNWNFKNGQTDIDYQLSVYQEGAGTVTITQTR